MSLFFNSLNARYMTTEFLISISLKFFRIFIVSSTASNSFWELTLNISSFSSKCLAAICEYVRSLEIKSSVITTSAFFCCPFRCDAIILLSSPPEKAMCFESELDIIFFKIFLISIISFSILYHFIFYLGSHKHTISFTY